MAFCMFTRPGKSCLVQIPQERGAHLGVASGGDPGDFRPDRASLPGHAAHESSQGLHRNDWCVNCQELDGGKIEFSLFVCSFFFSGIVCGIYLIQLGFSCLLFVYITLRCESISNGPTIRYPFGVWLLNCPPPMVQLRLFGYGLPSSLPQDIIPWHFNGSNFSKLAWGCWTYITRLGGTIHRIGWWGNLQEPLYLMVKTMVSCRFSFKPIHWTIGSPTLSKLSASWNPWFPLIGLVADEYGRCARRASSAWTHRKGVLADEIGGDEQPQHTKWDIVGC